MRTLIIFIFVLLRQLNLSADCRIEYYTLTELLQYKHNLTIFKCKIISTTIDSNQNISSTALISEVYLGKTSDKYVTLNTGSKGSSLGHSFFKNGSEILVYTTGNGKIFKCGVCDIYTKEYLGSSKNLNEIFIIKEFAKIYKTKMTGIVSFYSENSIELATGEFHKGKPVNTWKHYNENGVLKIELDLKNRFTKYYDPKGNISSEEREYKDSSVSISYSNEIVGLITGRSVSYPQKKELVSIDYYYFKNGNVEKLESYISYDGIGGKDGKYVEYYENGNIKLSGQYERDRRVGLWKSFNENGILVENIDYKTGIETK